MLDLRETVAGGVGAVCCAYSGNPFDVVKVRLQTQGAVSLTETLYNGPIDCIRKIYAEEGMVTFWKGVTPSLGSALIENSVLFTANGIVRRQYVALAGTDRCDLTFLESSAIGGLSGVCSATCITPAEMLKCRTMVSHEKFSPAAALFSVVREEGVRGLFRGLSCTIMRDVPFTFFFFGGYEVFTHLLRTYGRSIFVAKDSNRDSSDNSNDRTSDPLNAFGIYLAGGGAGAVGWSLAFPMDCIKSRVQTAVGHATFRGILRDIYAQGGVRGFYRGWSSAVLRAFPANAGLFLGYETAMKFLGGSHA